MQTSCWCGDSFESVEKWEIHSKQEHTWMHEPVSYNIGSSGAIHSMRNARLEEAIRLLKTEYLKRRGVVVLGD